MVAAPRSAVLAAAICLGAASLAHGFHDPFASFGHHDPFGHFGQGFGGAAAFDPFAAHNSFFGRPRAPRPAPVPATHKVDETTEAFLITVTPPSYRALGEMRAVFSSPSVLDVQELVRSRDAFHQQFQIPPSVDRAASRYEWTDGRYVLVLPKIQTEVVTKEAKEAKMKEAEEMLKAKKEAETMMKAKEAEMLKAKKEAEAAKKTEQPRVFHRPMRSFHERPQSQPTTAPRTSTPNHTPRPSPSERVRATIAQRSVPDTTIPAGLEDEVVIPEVGTVDSRVRKNRDAVSGFLNERGDFVEY